MSVAMLPISLITLVIVRDFAKKDLTCTTYQS